MSSDHRVLLDILKQLGARVSKLEGAGRRALGARDLSSNRLGMIIEVVGEDNEVVSEDRYREEQSSVVDKPKRGKPYFIPDRIFKPILDNLNEYWRLILGVPVNFKMTKEDLATVTASDTALFRNTFLSGFFVEPPVVVDAYSGIGMDAISFLENLYFRPEIGVKFLYAVENSDDHARNLRLLHNVHEYIRVKEGIPNNAMIPVTGDSLGGRVEFYPNGTEEFFQNCKKFKANPVNSIDLLYIDPPWILDGRPNSGPNGEATPIELLEFLYETIFKHLIQHEVHVRMVCIKTRFTWEQCKPFLDILRSHMKYKTDEFTHTATIKNQPFKNVYYFHVIKTNEADYGEWKQSKAFQKAYKTMKQGEVEGGEDTSHRIVQHSENGQVEWVNTGRKAEDGQVEVVNKGRRSFGYQRPNAEDPEGKHYSPGEEVRNRQ